MENETPTAEQLVPDQIEKRKESLSNFFTGWVTTSYDKLFILILLIAFIIRVLVYTKTQDQALWWDAADYMAAAKRWGLGLDTIDIWYYRRGMLWPLIGAFLFKIGLGEYSIRFLVALLSTGIVFVSYHLIATMFNKKLALLTSIPITMSWVFIFFTGRPLTNLPATFFLITSILFFWRGYVQNRGRNYFILFGIFYGFACLIRMQYLMFAPSFLVMAIIKERWKFIKNKYLWLSIFIFLIIFIPQIINHNAHFGNPVLDLSKYYLGIGNSDSGEVGVGSKGFSEYFYYFLNMPYILDGNQAGYSNLITLSPIYMLFIIGFFLFFIDLFLSIDKIFESEEIQKRFFVFFLLISLFSIMGYIAGTHVEQRYLMVGMPFLFLIVVYPLYLLVPILKKYLKTKTLIAIVILSLVLFFLLMPNYNFGFDLIGSKTLSYNEIKLAGEWIKANSDPSDIVIGGSLPQLTYYSERTVYPLHLAYRREIERSNEQQRNKFILENRPRYYSISVLEADPQWTFEYPAKYPEVLTPVHFLGPQEQPILIIYEFNYSPEAIAKLEANLV